MVLEDSVVQIPLTYQYRHLGGLLSAACSMMAELRARAQRAQAAFWRLAKAVFHVRTFPLTTKIHLFKSTVMSILLWGSGTWPWLTGQELEFFSKTVWGLYRRLAQTVLRSPMPSRISQAEIMQVLNLPHPADLLHEARARHLASLCLHGPDPLWAVILLDETMLKAYQEALYWMFQALDRDLKAHTPSETWEECREWLPTRLSYWKSLVSKASVRHLARRLRMMEVEHWETELGRLLKDHGFATCQSKCHVSHWCLLCERPFLTKRAWFLHAHHKHDYRSVAGTVVQGRFCPLCQKLYKSTDRLHHHLSYSRKCRHFFWSRRHDSISQPDGVDDAHPQCPWIPLHYDFVPERDFDDQDPDLKFVLDALHDAFGSFVPPEDDHLLTSDLVAVLKNACRVARPYDIVCKAFNDWARFYLDSTDVRLLEALHDVGSWLHREEASIDENLDLDSLRVLPNRIFSPLKSWRCTEILFLHLYSGRRRCGDLQHVFEQMQWPEGRSITVISIDVEIDPKRCDLSQDDIRRRWLRLIISGEIAGIGSGPPCESWSVARFNPCTDGKAGPRPVRLDDQPWGLTDVTKKEAEQLTLGNLLLGFAAHASLLQALNKGFVFLEHPEEPQLLGIGPQEAPSIWRTRPIRWFLESGLFHILHTNQGWFGAASPKPTALLLSGVGSDVAQQLEAVARSHSMPTARSIGREGAEWATHKLKEYPPDFNRLLGRFFDAWLQYRDEHPWRPLSEEHRWVFDLYRDLGEAPVKAKPGPDFFRPPAT